MGEYREAVHLDTYDITEACQVVGSWWGRLRELPAHLRAEIAYLASCEPQVLVEVQLVGAVIEARPSARYMALVANLRALDSKRAPVSTPGPP